MNARITDLGHRLVPAVAVACLVLAALLGGFA